MRSRSSAGISITSPPMRRRRPTSRRRRRSRRHRRRSPAAAARIAAADRLLPELTRMREQHVADEPRKPRETTNSVTKPKKAANSSQPGGPVSGCAVEPQVGPRLPFRGVGRQHGDDVVDAAGDAAGEIAGLEARRDGVGDDHLRQRVGQRALEAVADLDAHPALVRRDQQQDAVVLRPPRRASRRGTARWRRARSPRPRASRRWRRRAGCRTSPRDRRASGRARPRPPARGCRPGRRRGR